MIDFPYKILVPQLPLHLITRPHLQALLCSIAERRLITISAPAGYGKTSLLTTFAHAAPLPVCWYTIDTSDQNPWVFLEYLASAIDGRFPGATRQTLNVLAGSSHTSFAAASAALARDVYAIDQDFVIVIDDWHLVDHVHDIGEVIATLLLRCMRCRVILASRSYPSLPNMMLLAARRQMQSLNEGHLRFTAQEVAAVLDAEHCAPISDEQVAALTEQLNGWITGILLSLQTDEEFPASMIEPVLSGERQIYQYLTEQVFDHQSPEVRSFLLDSALLEDLSPEHCDMMLNRTDSRRQLDALRRRHLFVTEIRPGVLRYHPVFREFLQNHYSTVDPDNHQAATRRLADVYAVQGQWLLAFERYIAINQREAAQQVIANGGYQLYRTGRLEVLERWFSFLSLEDLDAQLLCLKARLAMKRGNHHEAQMLAQLAEARMKPGDEPIVLLEQARIARITGAYERALAIAEQVLAITENPAQCSAAKRTIAICHHRQGLLEAAISDFQDALAIEQRGGDFYEIAQLQHDIGICYKEMGQLERAQEYYTQADAYWEMIGNTGQRALTLNSKGSVLHLAGNYHEAHATLLLALRYAREAAVPDYEVIVLSSLGDLYSDLQLWDRAHAAYDEARTIGGSAHMISYLTLERIRLQVRERQFAAAAQALQRLPDTIHERYAGAVALMRASVACGQGAYEQAFSDVAQAIALVEQSDMPVERVRAYLLQAHIAAETRPFDNATIIEALKRVEQIAEYPGHTAFVMVETLHMRNVLRRAALAGWKRAEEWLERHQDILLAAKVLDQDDQRLMLVVRTLGADQIVLNGQPVELGWQKAREVLYYLLSHSDSVPNTMLREAIWPDLPEVRSRDTLRAAIYQLRSVLPRDLIELESRKAYRINRQVVRIDYDVEHFLSILDSPTDNPEILLEALDLYRGAYLPFTDNEWCVSMRAHLEQRYQQALHRTAKAYERRQAYADALTVYQRVLVLDTLDEAAHAGIMRCQIGLGNRGAAINQYQTLRRVLDEELGLELERSSEAENLYRELLAAS
jgi:ATP/maltotriose-dependent transcriptional regulator MalT/DNA-binding SARP family transcriptional activator